LSCDYEFEFICQRPKQDYEYKVVNQKMNWHDARDNCLEWGGDLATVRDEDEQNLLFSMGDGSSPYWLGYHEKEGDEHEGDWHWVDNDPATFTFWGSGEPNNYYRNNFPEGEDCMCFWHGPRWNDWWCDKLAMSMCKKVTSYTCTPGEISYSVDKVHEGEIVAHDGLYMGF
jgi:hypothetical protein